MVLTQLIINLRYALMSLSLSQKLSDDVKGWQRLIIAYGNTDEIFAVAMAHQKSLTFPYMIGLQSLPVAGWTLGTILGSVAAGLMPKSISTAMSVALYGMFIAVVVPVAKKSRPVMVVAAIAIIISCCLYYIPALSFISEGIGIILVTIVAAGLGAVLFPVKNEEAQS
jgi:predicted branched-subunit amino acid permease